MARPHAVCARPDPVGVGIGPCDGRTLHRGARPAHHVSARASQRSGTVDRVGDVWRSRRDSYRSRAFIPWAWGRAATAVLGEHADWRAVAYHLGASPVAVGASGYGYPTDRTSDQFFGRWPA